MLHEYIDKFWGWIGEACELLGFCFASWDMQTERRDEFLRIMKGNLEKVVCLKKKGCWQGVISIRGLMEVSDGEHDEILLCRQNQTQTMTEHMWLI